MGSECVRANKRTKEIQKTRSASLRLHTIYPDSRAFSSVGFVSLDLSRKLLGIASPCLPFFACIARRKFSGDARRHRRSSPSRDHRTWCRRFEQFAPTTKANCCEHRFLAKIRLDFILRFFNIKYLDIRTLNQNFLLCSLWIIWKMRFFPHTEGKKIVVVTIIIIFFCANIYI